MANSPVSSSEPPGPSSSGVRPEMISTPDLSGSRKISSRKNRAARFSPMEGLAAVRKHSRTPLSLGALRNSSVGVFLVVFRSTLNGHLYCYSKHQRVEGCEQNYGFHPMASPLKL